MIKIIKIEKVINIYGKPCLNATVEISTPKNPRLSFGFSQNEDETEWFCDSSFRNGLPMEVHGIGSRCCKKMVAQGELREKLNKAKREKFATLPPLNLN